MSNAIQVTRRPAPPDAEEKERQSLAAQLAQALRKEGRIADALAVQFDDIAMRALYLATNLANAVADLPLDVLNKIAILHTIQITVLQVQGMAGELKSLHQEQIALLHRNPPR